LFDWLLQCHTHKENTDEYREYCKGDEPISLVDSGDFATVLDTWEKKLAQIQDSTGASKKAKVHVLISYFLLHQQIQHHNPKYHHGHWFHNICSKYRMAHVVLGVHFWDSISLPTIDALYQDSKTIRKLEFCYSKVF